MPSACGTGNSAVPHSRGNVPVLLQRLSTSILMDMGELKNEKEIKPYLLPVSCCGAQCNRLRVCLGRAVMSDGGKALNPQKLYICASLCG